MKFLILLLSLTALTAHTQVHTQPYEAHDFSKVGLKELRFRLEKKIKMDTCNTLSLEDSQLSRVEADPDYQYLQRFVTDVAILSTELDCESDVIRTVTVKTPAYEVRSQGTTSTHPDGVFFTLYAPAGWKLKVLK
ncbi:MAG TPA: hypothetical protein VNJ01_12120 [Bacteriovoracaceae bacterium]|nr:hypothetical protein [Bacteriovoracaceae bacterium]